jgi:hypothetical protein
MKKAIAQRLNELADLLPIIFEEKEETVLMSGKDLFLTPFADMQELDFDKVYAVPVPMFIAVEHKQQLKDRYKYGGMEAVKSYIADIRNKEKNGQLINIVIQ